MSCTKSIHLVLGKNQNQTPLDFVRRRKAADNAKPAGDDSSFRAKALCEHPDIPLFRVNSRPGWAAAVNLLLPGPTAGSARGSLLLKMFPDFLAALISYLLGWWVAALLAPQPAFLNDGSLPPDMEWTAAAAMGITGGALFTLISYSEGRYRNSETLKQREGFFKALLWSSVLLVPLTTLSDGRALPRSTVAIAVLAQATLLPLFRLLSGRTSAHESRNVLVVGCGPVARQVARRLEEKTDPSRSVRGFVSLDGTGGADVLGSISDLGRVVREQFVDELIIAEPQNSALTRRALREARKHSLAVRLVPDLLGGELQHEQIEHAGRIPLLSLQEVELPAASLFLKRAADIAGSLIAILILAPALIAIAIAVKIDSRAPVLYDALRVGKRGRRFRCYKFRTMVVNADALKEDLRNQNQREGAFFKIKDDPRVTRLGRILRRYSLDELPQLWNVLRGEMSLVGPRPHPLDDVARYASEDLQRLWVTPGLTGLWQVEARHDPSFARNIALDLAYIRRWSLWLDVQILARTLRVVVAGTGS